MDIPCLCNDDVVEGGVAFAEAGEANLEDHYIARLMLMEGRVLCTQRNEPTSQGIICVGTGRWSLHFCPIAYRGLVLGLRLCWVKLDSFNISQSTEF